MAKLTDVFSGAASVAFVHFRGLTVAQANAMRRGLDESGVSYQVIKKTLMDRAFEAAGISGEKPPLENEIAIAWSSDDYIAPAREIKRYGKQFEDAVTIVGGIFDGAFMSQSQMQEVADIPSRETLYGQIANVINSPIQGLVVSLNQVAEQRETASA